MHVCVGAGFGGLARSTVLDMFSLRYLLDIQVKVLSQKLIICVLSSEERLELERKTFISSACR